MNLTISNIAWSEEEDLEMFEYLKSKNIKYLEVAPTRLIKDNPYDKLEEAIIIKNNLKTLYDLNIVSMQSIWFGKTENIFESLESYNALIDYTKKCIDFANAIGCNNLVFGCPKNRTIKDYNIDYPKAVNFFTTLGKYALNNDVVISIEPNPTIYNTNFLNTTSETIDFVKKINIESIKINYDLGTVIENNEDLNILKENLNLINHIHISEPNLETIKKRDLTENLIKELKYQNYNKTISIEMKRTELNKVKETINYLLDLLGE